jgi:hypothetical protein
VTWARAAHVLGGTPSHWACYRFCRKLREHSDKLADCLDRIIASLAETLPGMGEHVAVDATDMPGFAHGQKYGGGGLREEPCSDPDAAWGFRSAVSTRKGGGFFGYKLHAPRARPPVCRSRGGSRAATGTRHCSASRSWTPPANAASPPHRARSTRVATTTRSTRAARARLPPHHSAPQARQDRPPECEHGRWTFAGADFKRKRTKYRCPTGHCQAKSRWIAADRTNPLIPRGTGCWRDLYRGRAAAEREFGRLKMDYGLTPIRVRGIERVALHADLVMLARLSQALAGARAVPLAA